MILCKMTVQLNLRTLYKLFEDQNKLCRWLMDIGLMARKYTCPTCGENMKLSRNNVKSDLCDFWQWQCKKIDHDVTRSIRKGTWIESSKLNLYEIIMLTYFWCFKLPCNSIAREVQVSPATVAEWCSYCRDVCTEAIARSNQVLGGPDVIVDIEECSFLNDNPNTGREVEKIWVFGALERVTGKFLMAVVPNNSKKMLLEIITKRILPGTVLMSKYWEAHNCLEDEDFLQLSCTKDITFSHSKPDARSKGTWAAAKGTLRKYSSSDDFHTYVFEYIWRKEHKNYNSLFMDFIKAVATLYPPATSD